MTNYGQYESRNLASIYAENSRTRMVLLFIVLPVTLLFILLTVSYFVIKWWRRTPGIAQGPSYRNTLELCSASQDCTASKTDSCYPTAEIEYDFDIRHHPEVNMSSFSPVQKDSLESSISDIFRLSTFSSQINSNRQTILHDGAHSSLESMSFGDNLEIIIDKDNVLSSERCSDLYEL